MSELGPEEILTLTVESGDGGDFKVLAHNRAVPPADGLCWTEEDGCKVVYYVMSGSDPPWGEFICECQEEQIARQIAVSLSYSDLSRPDPRPQDVETKMK